METITLKQGHSVIGKVTGKDADGDLAPIVGIVYRDYDTGILQKDADPNNPDEAHFKITALAPGNTTLNINANSASITTSTEFSVIPPPPAATLEVTYEPVQ